MAQSIADRRDVEFVLYEQLKVDEFAKHEKYADFNKKTVDQIVNAARNLSVKEVLPTQKIGDQEGCKLENGKVTVPEVFHKLYKLFCEGDWVAMNEDPEWGGQGMPVTVSLAASEYFNGANYPFMMYPGLTHGCGNLVYSFGTEKQKKLYLKNLYTGKWAGTMMLTEPGAGSDVGALATTATKNPDGTYNIKGEKIFISGGEHNLTENIIHPVLARIEGAPAGTKGISLFLVPKIRVNDDGTLGEPNDVICTGIEHKMGIHGNSTASVALGSKGQCIGTLLGEENKGMKAMFQMMNEARLLVGMQGFSCATSSYINAVNYAKQRVQGKNLLQTFDPNAKSVPIIQHPDIRRMLLTMKAYIEGMRSLLYYCGWCEDKHATADTDGKKEKYQGILDILIPIAKGYVTDRSFDVCSMGMQTYGGYGYIEEYPMSQLLRDCRITMIYEGTNGIQAMDLLGRKLGLNKGKAVMGLFGEIQKTIAEAKKIESLKDIATKTEQAVNKLAEVAMHMGTIAMSAKVMTAFSYAYSFMEVTGDVVMSWMLLWRATLAAQGLTVESKKKDQPFFEGQIKSAEFFSSNILPLTLAKMDVIKAANSVMVDISEDSFIG
ncbi:MAG: acyl-CoA dehydrogenase [Desulfobacterales bacterium]|nr:acyl-CoA dehydrogenase [Desulfobacterales bacterium]